jgi:CPA1 family monovalent cation:H+ antiporter
MAMALCLPNDFPLREQMVISTFGIVLFTLLIPGLSVEPLIKRLKLTVADSK